MTCDMPHGCGKPAVATRHGMCVHEHYRKRFMCAEHEPIVMRKNAAGTLICEECLLAPDRHRCPVAAELVPA